MGNPHGPWARLCCLDPQQGWSIAEPGGYQRGSFWPGRDSAGWEGAPRQPGHSPWEEVGQGMQEVEGSGTPELWAAASSECPCELQFWFRGGIKTPFLLALDT